MNRLRLSIFSSPLFVLSLGLFFLVGVTGCNNKNPNTEKEASIGKGDEQGDPEINAAGRDTGEATDITGKEPEADPTAVPEMAVVGRPLPPIQMLDANTKTIQLRDLFFGKVGVVAFVKDNCDPCVAEMVKLKTYLENENLGKDVMVAVVAKTLEGAQSVVQASGVEYPVFNDNQNEGGRKFGVNAPGTFFLIDRQGQLQSTGTLELDKEIPGAGTFLDLLKGVVAGKNPDPSIFDPDIWKRWAVGEVEKRAKAPEFSAKGLDGKTYTLSKVLEKKNVVLVFFNRSCPHCQREMPHIEDFYKAKSKELNFEVLAVTPDTGDTEVDQIRTFVRDYQLSFPVIPVEVGEGNEDSLFNQYGIASIPAWGVIGRDGKFRITKAGENPDLKNLLTTALQEANKSAKKG